MKIYETVEVLKDFIALQPKSFTFAIFVGGMRLTPHTHLRRQPAMYTAYAMEAQLMGWRRSYTFHKFTLSPNGLATGNNTKTLSQSRCVIRNGGMRPKLIAGNTVENSGWSPK
jgi:hypothetical protein